jgi:hypothetical protein
MKNPFLQQPCPPEAAPKNVIHIIHRRCALKNNKLFITRKRPASAGLLGLQVLNLPLEVFERKYVMANVDRRID